MYKRQSKAEALDEESPVKRDHNDHTGMGSPEMRAMREKKAKMREMKEEAKNPESDEDSENVSETGADAGAVEDLSSGGEDKQWATPRNDNADIPACPLTIADDPSRGDLPLNAIAWRDESHPQWVRVRSVMDSGAAQSVAPPSMAPGVSIEASPGSQRGQHYVSASGGRLPNMGQQKLRVQTNEGREAMVLYQVAEVSRPLTAVSQTCDNGNWVVYTPKEALYG